MIDNKNTYCFITDERGKYYRAARQPDGSYVITNNAQPYPIDYSPKNLEDVSFEFGTNESYFSLNRSVVEPLIFIEDGAAILRYFYHIGRGVEAKAYITIIDWDGGKYALSYKGKVDFKKKTEDPKTGSFTAPTIDDSAWGVLSQNDQVEYAIECNSTNPKAVRILFDGITLKNRFTYQTVQAPILQPIDSDKAAGVTMPFVQVNQDGDSAGILNKDQTTENIVYPVAGAPNFDALKTSPTWFFKTAYAITDVNFSGSFKFQYDNNSPTSPGGGIVISLMTSKLRRFTIYNRPPSTGPLTPGQIYSVNFDITLDLDVSEAMFLILEFGSTAVSHVSITPIVTNTTVTVFTIQQPIVAYGLRPKDLLQQLVSKATNNRYAIDSLFFVENNKDICLSGDSLRGVPNAKIYSNFRDFFMTFDALDFMGLRTINDQLWMEEATEIYRQDSTLIDIGEAIDVEIRPAEEFFGNMLTIGSPDVDMRHPSGRLEFNCENVFSMPLYSSKKNIEVMTVYHTGCYEIQFLILDYQNSSTVDNSSDKKMFVVKITDEHGSAEEDIETFENVTIDNAPLNPFIKSPLNNDVITNNKPVIRGIAKPGDSVKIYVDNVLDGSTVADAQGIWSRVLTTALSSYDPGVATGIHVIEATFTDNVAPTDVINIQVDTTVTTVPSISYPGVDDNLYNNKPLIKGVAQAGTVVDIVLDGVALATRIADESCKWEFKVIVPISNGNHVLSINAGADTANFAVDSFVEFPLITYIGSELDGFVVINNLPLIQGVAIPGTVVEVWLNYISNKSLDTAVTDANGNWSLQTVPVSYLIPPSPTPIVLSPIPNGLNIISTSLVNHVVSINAQGYKLSRPAYSSITGVTDNTVFNTEYSPKRMLNKRKPLLAAICAKQAPANIAFQRSSKNGQLRTTLDGVTIAESDNVPVSSLGTPLLLLEYAIVKTKVYKTFANLLRDFNKGGIVKFTYKGTNMFCLPIGSMKMNALHSGIQEWRLLMSPMTTYTALMNLYRNGVFVKLNIGTMFHSDYNTLHMVRYNYSLPERYKVKDLYDDWFNNRNEQWLLNPDYIQKVQKTDPFRDQIVVNGVSLIKLCIYRCYDAILVDTLDYIPVINPPIVLPEIVQEVEVDWTDYPEGQYFCVWRSGSTVIGISERIETRNVWPGTILIESSNSMNPVGFFFSTGIVSSSRVEGMIEKQQFDIENIVAVDQNRYTKSLYSTVSAVREIRFGTAYGLPDYLAKKIAMQIILDNLLIEGKYYTLKEGEKFDPSEDYQAHPLYYYSLQFLFRDNHLGIETTGPGAGGRRPVFLVVDAEAVGLPPGQVIHIGLDNG